MKTLYLATLALVSVLAPVAVFAQATTKTTTSHTPTKTVTHRAGTASTATPLPKNIPAVPGIPKSLYALRYVDSKLGTGADAMPGWIYKVHYTGWLYDGTKFDSSVDRGTPFEFPQGMHRVIPGWDTGFAGMKVGGKRRLFIPYQLAYGEPGRGTIPPKANLIFDIEFVDQRDPAAPPPAPPTLPAPPKPAPSDATPPAGESTSPHATPPKPE